MPYASTEDQLVEQLRTLSGLFAELGWQTVSALEDILGKDTGTLRRTRDLLLPKLISGKVKLRTEAE